MTNSDVIVAQLQATARTDQCRNVFFKQSELKALHDALRSNASQIKEAIQKDTSVSSSEARTEVAVALSIVKDHYQSLDPKKELEYEYRTSKGIDTLDRREPWGLVYIEPDLRHTPFLSVIAPLSAAIAAGNCVLLKLESSLRQIPALLRTILPPALSQNSFAAITSTPNQNVLQECLEVVQTPSNDIQPQNTHLVSANASVVAVVDRSADLIAAAEHLAAARFALRGTSRYAPDIVLVNEFVKKEFLEALIRSAIPYITTQSNQANGSASKPKDHVAAQLESLKSNANWHSNVITSGQLGAIVDLTSKTNKIVSIPDKISAPVLAVSTFTSLEHAIDLATASGRLSAAYFFAEAAHAKYLDQYVASEVSFVNHVPAQLLLGPIAPLFHPFDLEKRYTVEHFTRAAPAFASQSTNKASEQVRRALNGDVKSGQALLDAATQPIQEAKRAEWIALGFFEQGIFIGLGVYGLPLLGCIGASLFYGVRFGLRKFAIL
ncbi:ALDH-like protein [Aaosphaeria arxii CBS 175.79]|uniref:ALDH-like protein n=1 Tax=Aaosphaeria arxii CBS 175.79 TaxID=1450172 RepID=A0A6A5Y804_9PLEO|nr:ALDH-like protein [Aaosphaeria arxii CBS 175.79]KAF2021436.1 ALDH-like protein [Aaosphaeria arxii CBS 175.79]